MGWLSQDDNQTYPAGGWKLSYLRPEDPGCQLEDHSHNDWLPTDLEFEDHVKFLWDTAGPEAQIALAKLKETNDHIGFSSAAINYFLDLTPAELAWIHGNLNDLGFGFSDDIKRQLSDLGELAPLELYGELGNLAGLTAQTELAARQNRLTLTVLMSASFFARLDEEYDIEGGEDFSELADLMERFRSYEKLFPIGRHLPCDGAAKELDDEDESNQPASLKTGLVGSNYYVLPNGDPLQAETNRDAWLSVRRNCVSATDARKLVTSKGQISKQRHTLLDDKINDVRHYFSSFDLGIEREPIIADWVAREFPEEEFVATGYLYAGENERHVATPDMIGPRSLCEIKVSTEPLKTCKSKYRDQLQWQLHVTGATRVLFAVENRYSQAIETEWIPRDEDRIQALVAAANAFLSDLDVRQLVLQDPEQDDDEDDVEEDDFEDFQADQSQSEILEEVTALPELPVFEFLDWDQTRDALTLYCQGKDPYRIAEQLDKPTNDVVATLGVHIFGLEGELVNPHAENWMTSWSVEASSALATYIRAGKGIDEICDALGRDRLGVLYKVLAGLNQVVPSRVMKAFKVDL